MQGRRRSSLLHADLETLGWKTSDASPAALRYAVQTMNDTVVPGDPRAVFLGRMYVMEGSTLGGQYIARHLEQQLRLPHGVGNSYFVGYGEQTGERWREVREVLAALPDEHAETVVRSAKNMFQLFGETMRSELSVS
jgi:heme oxygenase